MQQIDVRAYGFIDFGCSDKGGSMEFGEKKLRGGRGLGLDIDSKKVDGARRRGNDALEVDLAAPIRFQGRVGFSLMFHFLEHLPSIAHAKTAIANAIGVSRKFVIIRQPWFDADGYLALNDLKFCWSDWVGHRNHMTIVQTRRILEEHRQRGSVREYHIFGRGRVLDSSNKFVVPLDSPTDQLAYTASAQQLKAHKTFDIPVYSEMLCVIIRDDKFSISNFQKVTAGADRICHGSAAKAVSSPAEFRSFMPSLTY